MKIFFITLLTTTIIATAASASADAKLFRTEDGGLYIKLYNSSGGATGFISSLDNEGSFSEGLYKFSIRNRGKIVSANVPIKSFVLCGFHGTAKLNGFTAESSISGKALYRTNPVINGSGSTDYQCFNYEASKPYPKTVEVTGDRSPHIQSIVLHVGALDLPNDLKASASSTANLLQFSLEQLNSFEANIKRTDRRHVVRLKKALTDTLALMVDDKGNQKLPVTHMTVQENVRLIMVLATVLNELLDDYSDIESVKIQVTALTSLSKQIRDAYGWTEGLAGASSKSYSALATVIDLELRDLVTTMSAFAASNASVFYELMKVNHAVNRAVLAKTGGDSAAKIQVEAFVKTWNAQEWQKVLSQLMNAPADYKGLVQPKLKLLLMAVESMGDKGELSITIPMDNSKK